MLFKSVMLYDFTRSVELGNKIDEPFVARQRFIAEPPRSDENAEEQKIKKCGPAVSFAVAERRRTHLSSPMEESVSKLLPW